MRGENVMEQMKVTENRKEDKKAFGKFICMMVLSAIGGAIVGVFSVMVSDGQISFAEALGNVTGTTGIYGNFVFTTITWIFTALLVSQSRKLYHSWDGEDEDVAARMGVKLSVGLFVVAVNNIVSFFFIAAGAYKIRIEELNPYDVGQILCVAVALLGMIYALVVNTLLQKNIINFSKEINPEKQGSVYDMHFQRIWHDSCDEMERLRTYQAGYKAFRTGNYTCMALWLFCVGGIMSWNFGMLPMTMVLIVWMAMTVSYFMECIRMERVC